MFPQKGAMHRVVTAHVRHSQIRLKNDYEPITTSVCQYYEALMQH